MTFINDRRKIKDLTEFHTGKWYEVGTFSTNDENEKLEVIAKFLRKTDALLFADKYFEYGTTGYHTLVIR